MDEIFHTPEQCPDDGQKVLLHHGGSCMGEPATYRVSKERITEASWFELTHSGVPEALSPMRIVAADRYWSAV